MKRLIAIFGVLILITGCGQVNQVSDMESDTENEEQGSSTLSSSPTVVTPVANFEMVHVEADVVTVEDGLYNNELASNNYQLGLEVLNNLRSVNSDKNQLISPVSLSFALAMLQNGAQGQTKEQITALLGDGDLNETYKNIYMYLTQNNNDDGSLMVANSYWMRNDLTPEQDFIDTLELYYNAEVYITDFTSSETVDAMNLWVEEQTNNMLHDTIDQISGDTLSILMNTLYFKGTWREQFDENSTHQQDFYTREDITTSVEMMRKTDYYGYYEDETCQSIELPYMGNTEMIIILPNGDLDEYLQNVADETLEGILSSDIFNSSEVVLSLPKFTFDAENNLNSILMGLGMTDAFSEEDADFSLMIEEELPVWVSRVFQNTRIELNEEGTEAAAVTVVEMTCGCAMPTELPPEMVCDHPFMFIIKDCVTDLPLFMGTYSGQ